MSRRIVTLISWVIEERGGVPHLIELSLDLMDRSLVCIIRPDLDKISRYQDIKISRFQDLKIYGRIKVHVPA